MIKQMFFLFVITIFFVRCGDSEIVLQENYKLGFSVSEAKLYEVENNEVVRLNDQRLEGIQNASNIDASFNTEGDTPLNLFPFNSITFNNDLTGKMISSRTLEEQPIQYILIDNLIYVEFVNSDRNMTFRVEDNGEKISACEYIITKLNLNVTDVEILSFYNCENYTESNAAQEYVNDGGTQDSFSIIKFTHKTFD